MEVFDFGEDDLEPFPRKFRRVQARKDAKVRSASTTPRQIRSSQNKKEDLFKTRDNSQLNEFVQEASKCDLPSLVGTVEPEVVVFGEDLIFSWGTVHVSGVEFKFMTDAIALKFCDDCGNASTINLPLNEITRFSIRTCEQTRNDILELTLLEIGMFLKHKIKAFLSKPVLSFNEEFTLATRIEKLGGSGLARKITSLCDRYKVLWRNNDSNPSEWRASWKNEGDGSTWSDLIYPRGDSDAVTVTRDDFLLLNPCEFISDTIVDFYIKYLQSKLPECEKKRVHCFNSFFFRKLVNIDIDLEQTGSTFEHIKRWTRDVDIFDKDFLFIPIMQSAHWSLIVVCYPGQLFKQDLYGSKGSSIVHFDSMEGFHFGVEKPIKRYLMEQWKHQFSTPIPKDGTSSSVKCLRAKVPQQTNFSDCGLFMLHYVEMFLKALESPSPKLQVSRNWFDPEDVASKRSMLQRLIRMMQEEEFLARSFKQVDIFPKELVSGSVPMVPDSPASQEKDVLLVDDFSQRTPALLNGGYNSESLASFLQPNAVRQVVGVNNLGDLSSGATMEVTHPMHPVANSESKDLIDVGEDLISKKTSNNIIENHCSECSTFTALTGLHKVHVSDIANDEGIAADGAKEVSNSASVEFSHPAYLLTGSSERHVLHVCESLVSREAFNGEQEKRQCLSSDSNPLHSKLTQLSNLCSTLRSDSSFESLVSDVSTDFNHCEKGAIPASSPRCSPCARRETSDDRKSSLDTILESVAQDLIFLKSSNSGEEYRELEKQCAGNNLQAQGSVDPLYISSDEETGFVKVQKIVKASKAQRTMRLQTRQRNASSSKSARGGTANNIAEGTENQPSNGRWRLRRKSQMS